MKTFWDWYSGWFWDELSSMPITKENANSVHQGLFFFFTSDKSLETRPFIELPTEFCGGDDLFLTDS